MDLLVLGRAFIGLMVLAAGVLKAIDAAETPAVPPSPFGSRTFGVARRALPFAEIVLGAALVTGLVPLIATLATLAFLAAVGTFSFLGPTDEPCSCFGRLDRATPRFVSRLRWLVLLAATAATTAFTPSAEVLVLPGLAMLSAAGLFAAYTLFAIWLIGQRTADEPRESFRRLRGVHGPHTH
jgi:hypothetical protein